MLGFFIVRRLIELDKVGLKTRRCKLQVYENTPIKNVTWLNRDRFWENYDWKRERLKHLPIQSVANQFIHSVASGLYRDRSRNWSEFLVFSDYEQKKSILRVPILSITSAFEVAINDWPASLKVSYSNAKMDYEVSHPDS